VRPLCAEQIIIDNFRCPVPYSVHLLYLKHLILGFEPFVNTIFLSALLYQTEERFLRLFLQNPPYNNVCVYVTCFRLPYVVI